MHPKRVKQILGQVVVDNNFGPKEYFNDKTCQILEYIESSSVWPEDILDQDIRLLSLFPLVEFQKMKITDEQKAELNPDKCWLSLILEEGGTKKVLLEAKVTLLKEGEDLVPKDRIPKFLKIIESVENPQSRLNSILSKFNSRKDELIISHNDFWRMNILKDKKNPETYHLIDFDLSCYNAIGSDLANLMMVNATPFDLKELKFKFEPENLPIEEEIKELIKGYLVLLSDQASEYKGKAFIQKLREGEFDSFVDKA